MRQIQADPKALRGSLERIVRQAQRVSSLTSQLLDVSRLRTGALPLEHKLVELQDLLRDVVERFRRHVGEDGIRIRMEIPPMPVPCRCDRTRIEQVVVNLLTNAIKYSPGGGPIDLRLVHAGRSAIVSVADRGVGIPADQQGMVFEPFFRTRNAIEAQVEGAGLGLHISKQIVEQHGGRMWFDSLLGAGSTFYFSLPLEP
ncbi:MAG: HAMP domain-containing histidine kinase [Deltaproteobacteria bacterium]|nr:HAMP domain-containing histidine kinase [Deltaproteobacteria bacterium]